jgi:hypothetical protein
MKYGLIIFTCLFCISIASSSQSNYGIRRTDAFFTEHMPGNIRVDDNGQPVFHGPDTITTIYIETTGSPIKWIAAWKDGKSFSVIATAINERPFEVGVNKINNKKIILKPRKGNKLWLLQLEKKETSSKPPVKTKRGEIILQGRSGGKLFIQKINSQTELDSLPSV